MAVKFSGLAYSGQIIEDYAFRVIIDLSTVEIPARIPVLLNHDPDAFIGYAVPTLDGARLMVAGELSENLDVAADVIAAARDGMPWQLSVGITGEIHEARPGEVVNGIEVPADVFVMTGARLREVSAVPVGADHRTEMKIAAGARNADVQLAFTMGGNEMTEEENKKPGDAASAAAEGKKTGALEAAADMENVAAETSEGIPESAPVDLDADATTTPREDADKVIAELRQQVAEMRKYVQKLEQQAAEYAIDAAISEHAGDLPVGVRDLIRAAAKSPEDIPALAEKAREGIEQTPVGKNKGMPVDVRAGTAAVNVADMMRKFINK